MKESDIRDVKLLDEFVKMSMDDANRLFDRNEFVDNDCPFCCNSDRSEFFEKGGFRYIICPECGALYASPRPTQRQLDTFYSKGDSGDFFASKFLMPYSESRRKNIFFPRAVDVTNRFTDIFEEGREIGDIGAGTGIFLEEIRKIRSDAKLVAIEPSEVMVSICESKGFAVIASMLENVDTINNGRFSLLCSFELFEHLFKPEDYLNKIYDLLAPGGFLYMTTLSDAGFDIQLLWDKHNSVNPPQHLNFGNPKAMKILFERCGYDIVAIETPGKLDWDIVEQRANKGEINLDRFWTTVMRSSDEVKEGFQKWLQDSNLSSHIRVVARKPQ